MTHVEEAIERLKKIERLWLNSFHSFSKKEEKLYNAFRRYYEKRFGTNSN